MSATRPVKKSIPVDLERLHRACVEGDVETLNVLVHDGILQRCKAYFSHYRETPLHTATKNNRRETVDFLIASGLTIDARDSKGDSPLHFACMAADRDLVEVLLKNGANVNFTNNARMMPIHEACKSGQKDIVKLLLSNGAVVNVVSNQNITPLYVAYEQSRKELLEMLMKFGANDFLLPQLHLFCFLGKEEKVTRLLAVGAEINSKDKHGRTPLHVCCQEGYGAIVKTCMERGANVNNKDNKGLTALHYASTAGNSDIIQTLTSGGAKVNLVDNSGNTPLHVACEKDHLMSAAALLEAGARPNIKNGVGKTALHHAYTVRMTELMITRGADMNVQDNDCYTPLHIACMRGDFDSVKILIENGARLDIQSKPWPGYMDNLANVFQELNIQKYRYGCTALYLASFYGFSDIVQILLDHGANVDMRNTYSRLTALHIAAFSANVDIIDMLIKKSADVDALSQENETALIAILKRYTDPRAHRELGADTVSDVVELLVNAGCKLDILVYNGEILTAVYNRERGCKQRVVTEALIKAGCGILLNINQQFLMELITRNDMAMVTLIANCGYKYDEQFVTDGCRDLPNGPELLEQVQEIFLKASTLQNLCRVSIRQQMDQVRSDDPDQNGALQAITRLTSYVKRKMSSQPEMTTDQAAIAHCASERRSLSSLQLDSLPLPDKMREFISLKHNENNQYDLAEAGSGEESEAAEYSE